jgi:UDP-N-acetylmuramoyl-tripeptide--D-alanyl-D-alanine ligase
LKPWDVDEIRRAAKAKWLYRASGAAQFNGHLSIDSRKVSKGDLFVAIAGATHDAHTFVPEVIAKGAAVILVHKEQPQEVIFAAQKNDVNLLLVEDTIAGLNRLAAAYRSGEAGKGATGGMRAKVIAVGGSNGKTTTKFIIHTLLAEKFSARGGHASPKSFNNNIGMPLTLLEVEPSHEYVILEIGTNHPGELAALGAVCRPDIAVITSIGLEHLEHFRDLEGVAKEEASIASFLSTSGTLVIPSAATELTPFLKNAGCQKIRVGVAEGDLLLTDLQETVAGLTFSINGRGSFTLPLFGDHNAMNAMMAIAVARRLGLSDDQIRSGLLKVQAPEMRFQPLPREVSGPFSIINDAYNANPSSMEASLRTFVKLPANRSRKVVVLGEMRELGENSPGYHRDIGELVGKLRFDLFIAIGSLMKEAAEAASAGGVTVHTFGSTAEAKNGVGELLRPGDQILLKGSRSMGLEQLIPAIAAPQTAAVAAQSESETAAPHPRSPSRTPAP